MREPHDLVGESGAPSNLVMLAHGRGDDHQAIDFYQQQLLIARQIGDRRGEAFASWNLGNLLAQQGELSRAADLLQFCVNYEREIGHPDAEPDQAKVDAIRQAIAQAGQSQGEQPDDDTTTHD